MAAGGRPPTRNGAAAIVPARTSADCARSCRELSASARACCHDGLVDKDLSALFTELCVDLGFCLAPDNYERLSGETWERPADLADAVFAAEGMSEPYDLHLWREVRDRIAQRLV